MAHSLDGKTVVVTAAAQGSGRASALAFAAAGATVHATDINEAALAGLDSHKGIVTRQLDVLNDDAVNAASILEMKDEDLDFACNLNVRAMIRTIRAVLPGMLERGDGSIINMSSV